MTQYRVVQDNSRDLSWFIDQILGKDLQAVIDSGAGYLAFGLIAQGIEFLGALKDQQEFHATNLSEDRFKSAIEDFFPKPYMKYNRRPVNETDDRIFLYEELRCGMVHVLRPNGRIGFTGKGDGRAAQHLQLVKEGDVEILVLVLEDFFEDFKEACRKAKNQMLRSRHPKLSRGYLAVYTEAPVASFSNLSTLANQPATPEPPKIRPMITGVQFPQPPPDSSVG